MSFVTISAKDMGRYLTMPDAVLIDLREREEYAKGHIPGAVNIPYDMLEDKKLCLMKGNLLILYCERGNISLQEARELDEQGYRVINVYGGIHAYRGKLSIDGDEKVIHNDKDNIC